MAKRTKVIVQKWEQVEDGWGRRPDGYSLHLTEQDRLKYVEAYWAANPDPDVFSCPRGTPYQATVALATPVVEYGVRVRDNRYPGDGGIDGWFKSRDCFVFLEELAVEA